MQKKKKWLIYGCAGIVLAALAIFLGLRYLPIHKLFKRPSSEDQAFITQQQGPGSGPFSYSFDFEVDPKAALPDDIYQGIAHSGNYSTKTFGKNTFSVSFEKTVRDLNIRDIKAVALSAWVYVFSSSEEPVGSLVMTVTNTVGVNTLWKGVGLHGPYVPRDKWFKISGSFDLSDVKIRPDDKIQVYFWNNSDTKILSDDFYVVFGTQAPRRGDSTLLDLTRAPYKAQLNIPPFPVSLLHLETTATGNENTLDITPNDQVVAGRFLAGSLESAFVVKPDGKPVLYHYCGEEGFGTIHVNCAASLQKAIAGARVFTGSFTTPGKSEIMFVNGNGVILAALENTGNPCTKNAQATLKEIWKSNGLVINGSHILRKESLVPCDLNGDRVTELLLVGDGGAWQIFRFSKNEWTPMASGTENRIGEWDPKYSDFTITAGKFIKGNSADLLLTVFSEKGKNRYSYALVRYNSAGKKFIKALPGRESNIGAIVGHDTLKPSDQFLFGRFKAGLEGTFLRYNRDWRYDLKELHFNDTTFVIQGDVDFTGYPKDQNPKYYEALKLVSGYFTDPAVASVLVIARNCKDRNYHGGACKEWEELPFLPNTLRFYSFKQKTQP